MNRPRLLEDILNQPTSLSHVLSRHSGEGKGAQLEGATEIGEILQLEAIPTVGRGEPEMLAPALLAR